MEITQRVRDVIQAHAGRPFYLDVRKGREWSFAAYDGLARSLVCRLRNEGLARGQRVGILLNNCPEFAALYLACLYGGWVAVPVNPALGRRDVRHCLTVADLSLLVSSAETADLIPDEIRTHGGVRFLCVGRGDDKNDASGRGFSWSVDDPGSIPSGVGPAQAIDPEGLFVITFTSGTTSRPKGVCHTARSLIEGASAFNEVNAIHPDQRFYHVLSMSYMAGLLNTLLCPFLAGSAVAVDAPFGARSALTFWSAPIRYRLDTLWLVPTICASLLRLDRHAAGAEYARRHVRRAFVGTAPLAQRLRHDFEEKYQVNLLESYGLSETLFLTANAPSIPAKAGSVGRPLPGVDLIVVDREGNPLAPGDEGEIHARVPFAMAGYWAAEGSPPPWQRGDWFATGDIGYVDACGHLFITGRKKDLIIRGGINLSPRSIEEVLLEHPAVQDAAVIGIPHPFYGEDTLAVLELRPGAHLGQVREELAAGCRAQLSPVAMPGEYLQIEKLPRSSSGKVNKAELRTRFGQSREDAA